MDGGGGEELRGGKTGEGWIGNRKWMKVWEGREKERERREEGSSSRPGKESTGVRKKERGEMKQCTITSAGIGLIVYAQA
jgi:hypothetical protein